MTESTHTVSRRSFLRTGALHLDGRQTILSAGKAIADTARRARL